MGKTLLFGFLHAKPCRTIMKLPQKVSFGSERCKIGPKLWLRSCPDLLLTPYIKKYKRENIWNIFKKYVWNIYIYIYIYGIY